MNCMTREKFIRLFMSAREKPQPQDTAEQDRAEHFRDRVREELRRLSDAERFDILFPVAVKPQWDAPSYFAALLLRELSPACPLSCEDAVRALLPEWDVSIEEVPFYLASRFGSARVRQAITKLEPEVANESEKQQLKTIAYWLDAYECFQPVDE
jgi:hypothetical protein